MKKSIALLLLVNTILGNPILDNVVQGKVSIDPQDKILTITASDKSIIEWQSFSIDAGEKAEFIQPSEKASCLNTVVGNLTSNILGNLSANGHIYLINPNGIIVGKSGTVDTASFLASTLRIEYDDFLNGTLRFQGNREKQIINEGKITASSGDVILLAHFIKNSGEIISNKGLVAMASGARIALFLQSDEEGFESLSYPISILIPTDTGSIENSGYIKAFNALLTATRDNPEGLAINQTGTIEAINPFSDDAGVNSIFLSSSCANMNLSGNIAAPNGTIIAVGSQILVDENALLDVSASNCHGTISIGVEDFTSDFLNINPTELVLIEKGAWLKADSLFLGNGGNILIGSMNKTKIAGTISARGGKMGGDGGTVLLYSDIQNPLLSGEIDLSAPRGREGIVLPLCVDELFDDEQVSENL